MGRTSRRKARWVRPDAMVQRPLVAQAHKEKNKARLHTACYGLSATEGNNEKGIFNSNEIQAMIDEFHIEDPVGVFFARE